VTPEATAPVTASATYVYAITDQRITGHTAAAVEGMPGVAGTPVRLLGASGLTVAVSTLPAAASLAAEDLWAHERVVEALQATGAVVPARFGSGLRDDAAATTFLRAREQALHAALSRVRGRVELAVRARQPAARRPVDDTHPSAGSGTAYLAERVARARSMARLRDRVHEVLMPLAVDSRWRPAPFADKEAIGAYLVDEDQIERFTSTVADLANQHDLGKLTCTGPWPPYSFVNLEPT
jgi:Gas vesicle synthesis protein GvpL/GvpF